MAIGVGNSANGTASTQTLNFSLTITDDTDMVVVGSTLHGSAGVLSITFDGATVTIERQETGGSLKVSAGYILGANLPGAGTFTVAITTTGSVIGTGNAGGAVALEGARQAGPEANAGSTSAPSDAISNNITTLTDGALLVDIVGAQDTGVVTNQTVDPGQTDRTNWNNANIDGGMSTKPAPVHGNQSMGWTWTGTAARDAHIVVAIAPPPIQDIRTHHKTFVGPNSTGSFTVDRIGFLPKACHIWATRVTDETITDDSTMMNGFCDSALDQAVVLVGAEDGVQNTYRDRSSVDVIRLRSSDGSTIICEATVTSFNDDEAVFNFSIVAAAGQDLIFHAVFFGGEDLQAEIVIAEPVSSSPVTGLAFQPEFVLVQSHNDDVGLSSFGTFCVGAFNDKLDEFNYTSYQGNNGANQNVKEALIRTTGFASQVFVAAITWEASVTAITADGFSWAGTDDDVLDFLCFNLGGIQTDVSTYVKSTAAAPAADSLPATGFEAGIVCMHTASRNGEAPQGVASSGSRQCLGAYTRGEQSHVWRTDNNNATASNQRSNLTKVAGNGISNGTYSTEVEVQPILRATPDPIDVILDPNTAFNAIYGFWQWSLQRRQDDDPPAMV